MLGAGSPDAAILSFAAETGAVILTLDADFHTLLALSGAAQPSVIRIRIEGLKARQLVDLIAPLLREQAGELAQGVAISVDERFARLQSLPLVSRR